MMRNSIAFILASLFAALTLITVVSVDARRVYTTTDVEEGLQDRALTRSLSLAACKRSIRGSDISAYTEQCAVWHDPLSSSYYFAAKIARVETPIQAIDLTNGSPKTVVIYLVGGPAGEPYLLPGATLSFLGKMFPDSLIIVPAYFGTRERMPLRFADSVELAQHEITELVNDIGRVFPGKSIFLVGESFGSYVAGGVSGANGTLYLSPPVTSPSEILRRTVSAAPEKTKTDKVLVSFFNQTQPRAPPRRLIRRWDILNGMLKSQRVIEFDIGNVLRRERCSLAILGRNDHLVKGIDIAPSQNINRKIFWIEGDNHKLPSITDESNLWIVQQSQRRWNQQCFSGDDERNEKH